MQNDPEKRLSDLIKSCFFSDEFQKTQRSMKAAVVIPSLTFVYFRTFNFSHPLKRAIIVSVTIGSFLNLFSTFSQEFHKTCKSNTPLGAKLRLFHQEASYFDISIPYYKRETLKAASAKKNSKLD